MKTDGSILILTNHLDTHADLMVDELQARNLPVVRVHTETLLKDTSITINEDDALVQIGSSGRTFCTSEVRSVWYRRPRPKCSSKGTTAERVFEEKECEAIIVGFYGMLKRGWVSSPDAIKSASSKIDQLRVAREIGWNIPNYIFSTDKAHLLNFARKHTPTVYKPAFAGNSVVRNKVAMASTGPTLVSYRMLETILQSEIEMPLFLQKQIDRAYDIRVTVIGNQVFATQIHTPGLVDLDSRVAWEEAEYCVMNFSAEDCERVKKYLAHYGLKYGAFDFIVDTKGKMWFLECNPAGQFAWIEGRTQQPMLGAMADLLERGDC